MIYALNLNPKTTIETCVHLAVKIAAAVYILYKVWLLLFRDRLFGLWDRLLTPPSRGESQPAEKRQAVSVVSRAAHVVLTDPRKVEPEPVGTIPLEPTGFTGQEEPVTAEDVDVPELPYIPSPDELDIPPLDDNEMSSSGVTYEDLSNAMDVLRNGTQEGFKRLMAAKTIYEIRDTEILDLIIGEISDAVAVDNLLKECLDGDGLLLKKREYLSSNITNKICSSGLLWSVSHFPSVRTSGARRLSRHRTARHYRSRYVPGLPFRHVLRVPSSRLLYV